MDVSIRASEVTGVVVRFFRGGACAVSKSPMHECHDSALLVVTKSYALIGVFDGVSGLPHARTASELAMNAIGAYVSRAFTAIKNNNAFALLLSDALVAAHKTIRQGATTASVALILNDGAYSYASIGDSHLYYRANNDKIKRITNESRDVTSIDNYRATRFVVDGALGAGTLTKLQTGNGKLNRGDLLFAVTDGITDNIYVEFSENKIIDASAANDLRAMLRNAKTPKDAVTCVISEIKKRMVRSTSFTKTASILFPKPDDAAIAAFQY